MGGFSPSLGGNPDVGHRRLSDRSCLAWASVMSWKELWERVGSWDFMLFFEWDRIWCIYDIIWIWYVNDVYIYIWYIYNIYIYIFIYSYIQIQNNPVIWKAWHFDSELDSFIMVAVWSAVGILTPGHPFHIQFSDWLVVRLEGTNNNGNYQLEM